jgi:hypothetical protein
MFSSGGRKFIRFANSAANIGNGPLEVYGVVQSDGTTHAFQRVWNEDASFTDHPAGTFSFAGHQDHNHWHFDDFANYHLRVVAPGGGPGAIVASSTKVTFCLFDSTPFDRSLPGSPQNGVYSCESQGISVGWADVYTKDLEGQNIDITSVADGDYWLESVCDPDNRLREASDANNTARIKIRIKKANNSVQVLASSGTSVVWVEDGLPAGATGSGQGGDGWTWVTSSPPPFTGTRAHQSSLSAGLHQHFFDGATETLAIQPGDVLFAHVYPDPANPPRQVMLQWNDGSWEHRAYWGDGLITWGAEGTASRRYMGELPVPGQWTRLEVPASLVGLEGRTLKGMAFTLYDGRATWDHSGKRGN